VVPPEEEPEGKETDREEVAFSEEEEERKNDQATPIPDPSPSSTGRPKPAGHSGLQGQQKTPHARRQS
jgi:hypothetical protein